MDNQQDSQHHLSKITEKTLSATDAHDRWLAEFRSGENEPFFNLAFDKIIKIINPGENDVILDAGCGSATKTIHLARRGMNVMAVDFSDYILDKAREDVKQLGLADRIDLQRENLLELSFENATFDYVLCWGVLMHIPDVEDAISELCRVLKPGGKIIISEGNVYSLQAVTLRWLKKLLGKEKAVIKNKKSGKEYWEKTEHGELMTRQTRAKWLNKEFQKNGLNLEMRFAGQFTEIYMILGSKLIKRMVHTLNNFWFKYITLPGLAYGNIYIYSKKK